MANVAVDGTGFREHIAITDRSGVLWEWVPARQSQQGGKHWVFPPLRLIAARLTFYQIALLIAHGNGSFRKIQILFFLKSQDDMGNKKRMVVAQLYANPGGGSQGSVPAAWRPCLGEPPGLLCELQQAKAVGSRASKHDTEKQAPGRRGQAVEEWQAWISGRKDRSEDHVCFKILSSYENSQSRLVGVGKALL